MERYEVRDDTNNPQTNGGTVRSTHPTQRQAREQIGEWERNTPGWTSAKRSAYIIVRVVTDEYNEELGVSDYEIVVWR
jgi:hypothetical protein